MEYEDQLDEITQSQQVMINLTSQHKTVERSHLNEFDRIYIDQLFLRIYLFVLQQMGGHGGLNILPQKKWNVYNWDNRQIVEKDKKLHAEKVRKQYEDNREQTLQNKIQVLKQENNVLPEYKQEEEKPIHSLVNQQMRKLADESKPINLFEEEEKILMNREVSELKRLKEEEFLKDKNMDYSTRFLGSYTDEKHRPWYSQKKGTIIEKPRNRHFKELDEVIYGVKTESRVTKEVVEVEKKQGERAKEEDKRDRTREKVFKRYEEYQDRYNRIQNRESLPSKDILKHEEDLLLKEYKSDKEEQLERLRQKRLRREEKERKRIEQLRRKRQN